MRYFDSVLYYIVTIFVNASFVKQFETLLIVQGKIIVVAWKLYTKWKFGSQKDVI